MANGRGGYRAGAGRKPSGKRKVVFYISEDEETALRLELERLRTMVPTAATSSNLALKSAARE